MDDYSNLKGDISLKHSTEEIHSLTAAGVAQNRDGYTLVELLVVIVIIGILALLAIPTFASLVNKARISRCASEVRTIEKDVIAYIIDKGMNPASLSDVGHGGLRDPWGRLYQYGNIANGDPPRETMFGTPLNTDFDIYSLGEDGLFQAKISEAESQDDIVRAGDGGWVGLGRLF